MHKIFQWKILAHLYMMLGQHEKCKSIFRCRSATQPNNAAEGGIASTTQ